VIGKLRPAPTAELHPLRILHPTALTAYGRHLGLGLALFYLGSGKNQSKRSTRGARNDAIGRKNTVSQLWRDGDREQRSVLGVADFVVSKSPMVRSAIPGMKQKRKRKRPWGERMGVE